MVPQYRLRHRQLQEVGEVDGQVPVTASLDHGCRIADGFAQGGRQHDPDLFRLRCIGAVDKTGGHFAACAREGNRS